jgi:hypothetical protein
MITIFCDFRQFSAKKWAFFSKTNVMIIFKKLALFSVKKANFFAENILKIITSVPGRNFFSPELWCRRWKRRRKRSPLPEVADFPDLPDDPVRLT